MKKRLFYFFSLFLFAGIISTTNVVEAQNRPYRATDRQVQALVTRIATNTDAYKNQLDTALNSRTVLSGGDSEDAIFNSITDFETATADLKQKVGSRQSANSDVEDVLNRAADINSFMQRNRLNANVQRTWTTIRTDLNTLASYYSVSWNWTNANQNTTTGNTYPPTTTIGGVRPYRVTDSNVQTLIGRIQTRTDAYKREVGYALDKGVMNNTRSEETFNNYISDFATATDKLRQNFDARRSTSADVEEVLNRAYYVDGFMRDYRLSANAETQWRAIRADLDSLSNYYSVSWNWNRQPTNRFDSNITGTYRLNASQSDNVQEIVDRATTNATANQRDRMTRNLERRLSAPDMLAIEKRGTQVTIASSTAPQVTFQADGVGRTETNANGRTIKTTATTNYDGIALSYEGDRVNDFYVNFNQSGNNQLRVVRRLYLENQNQTVTVASVYDKIKDTADLTLMDNQTVGAGNGSSNNINDFIVANNTPVTANLKTPISTKTSQNGDRFQMEVTSPSEYNGAIIEGRVASAERSGRVSGRANVSLEFDTIRLRNGQTYRFGGIVNDVRLASGEKVTVNNEGTVRDNNQTTKTAQRAGIGAALGALIGAIAGGGQGAAIGAGVGAGAGAGSVILQGRDDVELGEGTQFTITATAPSNTVNR